MSVSTMKNIIFAMVVMSVVLSQAAVYHKVLLKDPDALCLDGSPGAYYISKGEVPERVLLFFEGGGWCGSSDLASTTESCYQRSKTGLGSSKNYSDTISFTEGFLSNNAKNDFNEGTKVFLKYCDGAGHQGVRQAPLSYKGEKLYFRGHNITVAQLDDLERTIGLFSKATDIIVSGGSAGGLAVFTWVNYIRQKAKSKHVLAVPDSGIFLNSKRFNTTTFAYRDSFANLMKLSNTDHAPPVPQCVHDHPNEHYMCMFAEVLHKYIKVPLFPIQSLYDTWSIANILNLHCVINQSLANCTEAQRDYIEMYRKNTSAVLDEIGKKAQNGLWAPSCAIHTFVGGVHFYSADFRVPANSQNSIDATLLDWVLGKATNHKHMDSLPWPYNKPCSGVKAVAQIE